MRHAQALASLAYLQPQLEVIQARAEDYDVPTPVIDALRNILHGVYTDSYLAVA